MRVSTAGSDLCRMAWADWYARVRARPGFETAVAGWLQNGVLDLFRTGGEAVWADVEPLTRRG